MKSTYVELKISDRELIQYSIIVTVMAQSQSNWSKETYRFDEIAGKFKLPLLVQVSEGFYRGTEEDSFSAGDITMFEQFVTLQKVAAVFARPPPKLVRGYAVPKEEILIPLNYKGKLRVEHEIKAYECVQELAKDFPRYATVLETIAVPVSGGGVMDIEAGTVVELDRIIPPRLVINTSTEQVGLNLEERYKFRSKRDSNVYTLREAVNRYDNKTWIKCSYCFCQV